MWETFNPYPILAFSFFFLSLTGNVAKLRRQLGALLAAMEAGEAHGREEAAERDAEAMQRQGNGDGAECRRGRG